MPCRPAAPELADRSRIRGPARADHTLGAQRSTGTRAVRGPARGCYIDGSCRRSTGHAGSPRGGEALTASMARGDPQASEGPARATGGSCQRRRMEPTRPSGLILTSDLHARGSTLRAEVRAERDRRLARVRRGAYTDAATWRDARPDQRYRLFVEATVAVMRARPVLAFHSAAVMQGIPVVGGWPAVVHVLAPRSGGGRSSPGIARHGVQAMPDLVVVDGLAMTSPARTVVDLARVVPFVSAVAGADHVLATGAVTRAELERALTEVKGLSGYRRAALVVAFADGAAESVGESLSRARIHELGLPAPELQHNFFDEGGFIGRSDFWWVEEEVAGEFDGRGKYLPGATAAGAEPGDVVWREKRREDRLRRQVRGVVRWGWSEALDGRALGRLLIRSGVVPRR